MKNTVRRIISLVPALFAATFSAIPAFAEEGAAHAASGSAGLIGLGAGVAVTFAALGCGMGQGKTVAATMDGIARNPAAQAKMFVPMIIGLAFMETLVIFSFVIAILLLGKI